MSHRISCSACCLTSSEHEHDGRRRICTICRDPSLHSVERVCRYPRPEAEGVIPDVLCHDCFQFTYSVARRSTLSTVGVLRYAAYPGQRAGGERSSPEFGIDVYDAIACIVCCIPHPPRGARVRLWIARGTGRDGRCAFRIRPDTDGGARAPRAASRVPVSGSGRGRSPRVRARTLGTRVERRRGERTLLWQFLSSLFGLRLRSSNNYARAGTVPRR